MSHAVFKSSYCSSMHARLLLLLTLATLAVGCGSAARFYEAGSDLEAQGKLKEAAEFYIQALQKDSGLVAARERLNIIGPKLIEEHLFRAREFAASQRYVASADVYRTIDAFAHDTEKVGVSVLQSDSYASERRRTFDAAIDQLMLRGEHDEARREWRSASKSYEQVSDYAQDRIQRETALAARVRVAKAWTAADLQAGRYRAAVEHADQAIALMGGTGSVAAQETVKLRQEAMERGTLRVAIVPLWRSEAAGRALSRLLYTEFLESLNKQLELNHWSKPPPFVFVIAPAEVRREMRQQGYANSVPSTREAIRLGEALGADLVLTGEVESLGTAERLVKERTQRARKRSGGDASYFVRTGERQYKLSVTYVLNHVTRSRAQGHANIFAEETEFFTDVQYEGDPRDLELTRSELSYFDLQRRRNSKLNFEERLRQNAARKIAARMYEEILKLVN